MIRGFHVTSGIDTGHIPRLSFVMLGQLIPDRLQLLAMAAPRSIERDNPFSLFCVFDYSRQSKQSQINLQLSLGKNLRNAYLSSISSTWAVSPASAQGMKDRMTKHESQMIKRLCIFGQFKRKSTKPNHIKLSVRIKQNKKTFKTNEKLKIKRWLIPMTLEL